MLLFLFDTKIFLNQTVDWSPVLNNYVEYFYSMDMKAKYSRKYKEIS